MKTDVLNVSGLNNQGVVEGLTHAMEKIAGVLEVNVSVSAGGASVRFDPEQTSIQELEQVLARAGFSAPAAQTARPRHGGCCGSCGG